MGSHTNYISVESDTYTALIITAIIILIVFISFIIAKIKAKKIAKKAAEKQRKAIKRNFLKEMAVLESDKRF